MSKFAQGMRSIFSWRKKSSTKASSHDRSGQKDLHISTNIPFNASILKILALYVGTSTVFLSVLFFVMYQKGLHNIRAKQLAQMRNDYIQIATAVYEHKDLKAALNALPSTIASPFAIVDSSGAILFSNLSLELPKILATFRQEHERFALIDSYIFIDMRDNRPLERTLTHPPFNLSKRPKQVFKYFDSLHWRVIIQGDAIEIIELPFLDKATPIESMEDFTSARAEQIDLRIEIITYLLCSLLVMSAIAYILTRLSLRPVAEKVQALERFIKDSTHEINTPLSVILLSVQKFDTKNQSEANLKRLNRIKISAKTLNHLYQNLIFLNFYTKTNAQEHLDLKALLEQRIEYFNPLFAQKSLLIDTTLSPARIYASIDEMRILLDNLLSNALKYNHKGGTITIILEPHSLSIQDTGIGMDSATKKHIFDRYARYNYDQGGFGIGLSLVREIASRYNIGIRVESEIGKGSCFILSWK